VFSDVIFLGSVLDLLIPFKLFDPLLRKDAWLDAVLPTPGESGIEPFLNPFLGGAIGPPWSPFGGRGGREDDTCSSSACRNKVYNGVVNEQKQIFYIDSSTHDITFIFKLTFLWCMLRFGCLWYISSHAKQNTWSVHCLQRTMAVAVPHKSHVEFEFISVFKSESSFVDDWG
jgi:hypothetical protein